VEAGDSLRGVCDMEGADDSVNRWDAALSSASQKEGTK
jgi:hypothetical protein